MMPIRFIYEVFSKGNIMQVNEEEQRIMISRFLALINNATLNNDHLIMTLAKDYLYNYPLVRVFLESRERLDDILYSLGYSYKQYNSFNDISFNNEYLITFDQSMIEKPSYLIHDDVYARVLTLTKLSSNLPFNFAYQLLNHADIVRIRLKRLEQSYAVSTIMRLEGLLKASNRIKLSQQAIKAEVLREALIKQDTLLYRLSLNAIIFANDKNELIKKSKEFRRANMALLTIFDTIPFIQQELFYGFKKDIFIELGSLAILYPFINNEMLEVDGILLGYNVNTKAAVVYDITRRDNYNIVILATSGAGKSLTAKIIVNRLLAKYDANLYIIDPQGEYEPLANLYNAQVINLNNYGEYGLDPFKLFDKHEASALIADTINADEVVKKEIISKANELVMIKSIEELYNSLREQSKRYLVDLITDPRLRGDDISLQDRTIFSLRGARAGIKIAFIITLALAKILKQVYELPRNRLKILLIDEGWLLFLIPTAANLLNTIARTGRKLGLMQIFLTQRPEDLVVNEYGRSLLDNSDTKILLRNDIKATKIIADALNLSKQEHESLPIFAKGECLLITKEHRLRAYIMASKEELTFFSTNALEH